MYCQAVARPVSTFFSMFLQGISLLFVGFYSSKSISEDKAISLLYLICEESTVLTITNGQTGIIYLSCFHFMNHVHYIF